MGSLIHMIILNIGNTTCQNCSASATLDDTEIPDIMNQNDKSFDEVDLTERIVTVVGKTLALAYCVGLVMIVMYYCYACQGVVVMLLYPSAVGSLVVAGRREERGGAGTRISLLPTRVFTCLTYLHIMRMQHLQRLQRLILIKKLNIFLRLLFIG